MKKELINILGVEKNFNSVIAAIREGYVYVSRFSDGVCILINNKGNQREIKVIMYNPLSENVTRFEMTKNQFKPFFNDVIVEFGVDSYKIKDSEIDVIEQLDSVTHALVAAKIGNFKEYRIKKTS